MFVCKSDIIALVQLDPVTLERKRKFSYENISKQVCSMINWRSYSAAQGLVFGRTRGIRSVRSVFDPSHHRYTGEYFNFVATVGPGQAYKMFSVSKDGIVGGICDIPLVKGRGISYIHAFSSTPKYLILITQPVYYAAKGIKILVNRNITDSMEIRKDHPVMYDIVDRKVSSNQASRTLTCRQ
jgi:hypothetical protein